MTKFWNWVKNDAGERILYLEGVIAEESWFEDDVTPAAFKKDLMAGSGPITLHINSPGGDCIAASQIYTMLMDYPYNVTVRIDGIAASAASVIAMAGRDVYMSPTSLMMIHNPLTFAIGDSEEMRKAIQCLDEVKESIINAYEIKTGLSRARLSNMMDSETWMNAKMALELGFCDKVLYQSEKAEQVENSFTFSRRAVTNCLLDKLKASIPKKPPDSRHEPAAEPETATTGGILLPAVDDDTKQYIPAKAPEPTINGADILQPVLDKSPDTLTEQRKRLNKSMEKITEVCKHG